MGWSDAPAEDLHVAEHKIYEYPYTPELFPWFYDKMLWRDSRLTNRTATPTQPRESPTPITVRARSRRD